LKADNHVSKTNGQVFVIGGASIYKIAISYPNCKGVFLTEITGPMKEGDVFFPIDKLRNSFKVDCVNQFAHNVIKESMKNVFFDGKSFSEKNFKYNFMFYH
jgi:dihydrofolate reductase